MLSLVTKGYGGSHAGLSLATKGVLTWLFLEEVAYVPVLPERLPRQFIPPVDFRGDESWYRQFQHARQHIHQAVPTMSLPRGLPAQVVPKVNTRGTEAWLLNFKNARSKVRR